MDRAPDDHDHAPGRRAVLRAAGLSLLALALGPRAARASRVPGRLRLHHAHTGERLDLDAPDALLPDARAAVDRLLRDHRTGDVHPIDPGVLATLWEIAAAAERPRAVVEVVSGYRSPRTNAALRDHPASGVARRSLHLEGRALDFRLAGVATRRVRDLALGLRRGGVGYYAASDFVHVDTGRPRSW